MTQCRLLTAIRTASAAILTVAPTVGSAADPVHIEPFWLQLPDWTEDMRAMIDGAPALPSVPAGWMTGDAAVVLIDERHGRAGSRQKHLAATLLEQDAAVLELHVQSAPMHLLLSALSAAIVGLHQDVGAGLVVAIGRGAGGKRHCWQRRRPLWPTTLARMALTSWRLPPLYRGGQPLRSVLSLRWSRGGLRGPQCSVRRCRQRSRRRFRCRLSSRQSLLSRLRRNATASPRCCPPPPCPPSGRERSWPAQLRPPRCEREGR